VTKFTQWYREIILPAGLLSSVIIGAGIFALPYVFSEAGFLTGLFYLILFTAVFAVVHVMYAKVIEHTKGKHRFVGYADIYFKRFGFLSTTLTTAIGFTLTLVAYIALAGSFIGLVLPSFAEFAPYIFWAGASLAVVYSLRRLAGLEFVLTLAMIFIIAVLFFAGILYGDGEALPQINTEKFFLPYGVVLFSLAGRAAISSIHDYYEANKLSKKRINQSIVFGTIAPALVYVLFVIAVIHLSGGSVTPDALTGLAGGPAFLLIMVSLLGIFALWTSYFFLAAEVRGIFRYDFKFKKILSTVSVVVLPILLYILGLRSFIGLVAIIGGVFLALDSIMAVSMYSKIKGWRAPAILIVLLFIVGAVFEALQLTGL